ASPRRRQDFWLGKRSRRPGPVRHTVCGQPTRASIPDGQADVVASDEKTTVLLLPGTRKSVYNGDATLRRRAERKCGRMVLSDRTIRQALAEVDLAIPPPDPAAIQPASVDVRLDGKFLVFRNNRRPYIDVRQPQDDLMEIVTIEGDTP